MIGNFNKTFKESYVSRTIPKKVMANLNKELPEGYTYEHDSETNHLVVKPIKGKKQKGIFTYSVDSIPDIPDYVTPQNFLEYLYRSQRTIRIDNIKFNDNKKSISGEAIRVDPLTGEGKEEKILHFIKPQPFPAVPDLTFELEDGTKKSIQMRRVPDERMEVFKIQNYSLESLFVEIILYEKDCDKYKKGATTITIKAYPEKAKNFDEALLSLKIVRDFLIGKLRIDGIKITNNSNKKRVTSNIEDTIDFYKKVVALQKLLSVKFRINGVFTEEEGKILSELCASLVDGKTLIYTAPFSHFTIESTPENIESLQENTPMRLSCITGPHEFKLLGTEFFLFKNNLFSDIIIKRKEKKGKKYEIYFSGDTDNWKLICSYHLSEKEAIKNQNSLFEKYNTN